MTALDPEARDRLRAAISNAYYGARNDGRTMESAADDAVNRVVAIVDDLPFTKGDAREVRDFLEDSARRLPNAQAVTIDGTDVVRAEVPHVSHGGFGLVTTADLTPEDAVEFALDLVTAAARIDPSAAHASAGWVEWLRVDSKLMSGEEWKRAHRTYPPATPDEEAILRTVELARMHPGGAPYRIVRQVSMRAERERVVATVNRRGEVERP